MPESLAFSDYVANAPLATEPLGDADRVPVIQGDETRGLLPPLFIFEVPTTGSTLTLVARTGQVQLDPAGTLAEFELVLPPTPTDRWTVDLSTSQTITALTVSPPGSETVNGGELMLTANGGASWRYRADNATWYRRY